MIQYEVIPENSQIYIAFKEEGIGQCKFWLPEGIGTPRGFAGVYPHGMSWVESDSGLQQEATIDHVFGPGNVEEVEPGILECLGVRSVKEAGLPWTSALAFDDTRVSFSLSVHNPHDHAFSDVCALLCLKFMDASWWSPETCFFKTESGITGIAETEWIGGEYPRFQKWHVGSETPYDNPTKNGIWTSNPVRATLPMWVVKNRKSGTSIVFACESAYYIHCNRNNPCHDIALKFGDMEPGQTVKRLGYIELTQDSAEALLDRTL